MKRGEQHRIASIPQHVKGLNTYDLSSLKSKLRRTLTRVAAGEGGVWPWVPGSEPEVGLCPQLCVMVDRSSHYCIPASQAPAGAGGPGLLCERPSELAWHRAVCELNLDSLFLRANIYILQ